MNLKRVNFVKRFFLAGLDGVWEDSDRKITFKKDDFYEGQDYLYPSLRLFLDYVGVEGEQGETSGAHKKRERRSGYENDDKRI